MKNVYIAKINYFDDENNQNIALCIFDSKEQAVEWIKHHRNMLEEDLCLFKKMKQMFYSTLSEKERTQFYINLNDLEKSFEKYQISPLGFDISTEEYEYSVDEYEIGKEGIVESYYEFDKPIIDTERINRALAEYEKQIRR